MALIGQRCHTAKETLGDTALTGSVTLLRASTRSLPVCWTRPVSSWDSTVASQPLHNILRAASASPVSFHVVWQRCRSGTSESRGARILFTACGEAGREGGKGRRKTEREAELLHAQRDVQDLLPSAELCLVSEGRNFFTQINILHVPHYM